VELPHEKLWREAQEAEARAEEQRARANRLDAERERATTRRDHALAEQLAGDAALARMRHQDALQDARDMREAGDQAARRLREPTSDEGFWGGLMSGLFVGGAGGVVFGWLLAFPVWGELFAEGDASSPPGKWPGAVSYWGSWGLVIIACAILGGLCMGVLAALDRRKR
jgi:hypothetical protein